MKKISLKRNQLGGGKEKSKREDASYAGYSPSNSGFIRFTKNVDQIISRFTGTPWIFSSCSWKRQKCFQLQCSFPLLACICSCIHHYNRALLCSTKVSFFSTGLTNLNFFLRVILILWGTNKFLKKLIKPGAINNNELADFISRVPDNEELVSYKYFQIYWWYNLLTCRRTSEKYPRQMK